MSSFFRKLRWLTQRSDKDAELRQELQFHLEEEAASRHESGLADDKARQAARFDLGNLALVEESTREAWGWMRPEQFVRDASYGLRQIRRDPMFSGLAIATLAVGIAGVAAMFSAVSTILIRPLPYADADRLVMIWDDLSHEGIAKHFPAPAEMLVWRGQDTVFTDIAATEPAEATLSGGGEPEQVPARKATGNLWSVLGVSPVVGRVFTEDEDVKGAKIVVISYGLWQRRFGGSPDVLGRTITMNDTPYEVVGVMPREFYFMPARDANVVLPWEADELFVARRARGGAIEARRPARAREHGDGGAEPAADGA
jgi:hypothetical protein